MRAGYERKPGFPPARDDGMGAEALRIVILGTVRSRWVVSDSDETKSFDVEDGTDSFGPRLDDGFNL